MTYSSVVRWGAATLLLSGMVWAVLGFSTVAGFLQAIPGREDVVLFVLAHVLLGAGLVGLHVLQKGSYGLLGRAGLYVALAAISLRVLGAVVFLAGSAALEWISPPATLGMLAGLALYGVATARAGVLPLWYGAALAAAMPVSFPLGAYGTTLFGVILSALGGWLWLRGSVATERPSRVS